jgi:hypothetical protein
VAPCAKCDGFSEAINFDSPQDYLDIVRQLMEIVGEGTFLLVRADCPLKEMFTLPWLSDCIQHNFQCILCGRSFELIADTHHGRAGWKPTGDLPASTSE